MKNSKKKLWVSLTGIGLSIAMLGAASLAATDNLSGYTRFKELMISGAANLDVDNATSKINATIKNNGEEIAKYTCEAKNQLENDVNYTSTVYTLNVNGNEYTEESWMEVRKTGSVYVSKRSDKDRYTASVYDFADPERVMLERDQIVDAHEDITPAQMRLMNAVIDMVAGDTKSHFRSDGDKISVNLEGAQIPELAQLALQVLEEEGMKDVSGENEAEILMQGVFANIKDMRFESISGEFEFSGKNFKSGKFELGISGVDKNGVKQTLTIECDMELTGVGSTVADRINLDDIKDQTDITKAENGSIALVVESHNGLNVHRDEYQIKD